MGTLRYMAPERFRGISDRSGDIYALGATLYELLTLRPAFDGTDQLRLIDRIVHEPPERPRQIDRHIPRDLETIVLKALAKDPKDRFGSARELADELRRFVEAVRSGRGRSRSSSGSGAGASATLAGRRERRGGRPDDGPGRRLALGGLRLQEPGRGPASSGADLARDARWRASTPTSPRPMPARFSRRPGQRFKSLEAVSEASRLLEGDWATQGATKNRESLRDLAIAAFALPDLRVARTFGSPSERPVPRYRPGVRAVRRVRRRGATA